MSHWVNEAAEKVQFPTTEPMNPGEEERGRGLADTSIKTHELRSCFLVNSTALQEQLGELKCSELPLLRTDHRTTSAPLRVSVLSFSPCLDPCSPPTPHLHHPCLSSLLLLSSLISTLFFSLLLRID
jgi:hypothetical protein